MANVTSVTKHFPVASETYTNNLSATISSGAPVVPVNSAADYNDGDTVVLVVEPGTTNEAVFTGEKASSPQRFVNCVWTEGNTGVGHSSGATIIDYVSATHLSMMTKGIKVHANDDGTLKTSAVQAALNISAAVPSDYTSLAQTATTVVPNGNRSYTLTFPGVNYTDRLTPGMRLRTVRSTAAPNQSASLNGTNQYFNKTTPAGMTFTDDFTVSAWVKMSSYTAGNIIGRRDANNGWSLEINASGQIQLAGYNGGGLANFSRVLSSQSIPLNKWVHISAQLDMSTFTATSTTSYIMIDGVDVPSSVSRGGTNPIALVQAGDLGIGFVTASSYFPGKIAQAAVFNAKITQATIRGYMSQGLSGSEPSLISAYTLSNSLNDLNVTNANNLTANSGAVTTNADSPFGGQADGTISTTVDYSIIQKTAYTTDTTVVVQVPEGCTIPSSGGVASVSYSQFKAPYGFPAQKGKWKVLTLIIAARSLGGVANTWYEGASITIPSGEWARGYRATVQHAATTVGDRALYTTLGQTSAAISDDIRLQKMTSSQTTNIFASHTAEVEYSVNTATVNYFNARAGGIAATTIELAPTNTTTTVELYAENAYL